MERSSSPATRPRRIDWMHNPCHRPLMVAGETVHSMFRVHPDEANALPGVTLVAPKLESVSG